MTAERAQIALVTAAALGVFVAGVAPLRHHEDHTEDRSFTTDPGWRPAWVGDLGDIGDTDYTVGFDDTLDRWEPPPSCFERPDRAACLQRELTEQAAEYIAGDRIYRPTGVYRAAQ